MLARIGFTWGGARRLVSVTLDSQLEVLAAELVLCLRLSVAAL